eukprot:10978837-Karenia_brevis.AAC.1
MVDKGADIPLEQILAGPKRGQLQFEQNGGNRSIGQIMKGDADVPHEGDLMETGEEERLEGIGERSLHRLPPGYFQRAFACFCPHLKEYRKSDAEGSEIVLEPTEEPVKIV